jgi:hypothetical protein
MRRGVDHALRCAGALLATAWLCPLAAQDTEVPRAPRIIGSPPAAASPSAAPTATDGFLRPPTATRLAPRRQERSEELEQIEEIIVIGRGWRLPDLGSEWRARQKEAATSGRFSATVLPLYDPEHPTPRGDPLFMSPEQRRHGYIDLFRLRFGGR